MFDYTTDQVHCILGGDINPDVCLMLIISLRCNMWFFEAGWPMVNVIDHAIDHDDRRSPLTLIINGGHCSCPSDGVDVWGHVRRTEVDICRSAPPRGTSPASTPARGQVPSCIFTLQAWPACNPAGPLNIASILPKYCLNIASILPKYCLNIASILPQYCLNIASILPQYCLNIASILP